MAEHGIEWAPMAPVAVAEVLAQVTAPWWIAGGWAIDLHIGQRTRTHNDTDVLVLRRDLTTMREALRGWDLHVADPPGTLRPWPADSPTLPTHVHDIWCRPTAASAWAVQLLVDDTDREMWLFRRDTTIRRPIATLDGPASTSTMRVVAPEVQLLYKSASPRPKDEADFTLSLPTLDPLARDWLRTALERTSPTHDWLAAL
ncbi:MAG TPA: hypothetical protein VHC43_13005 [Mycobacteriales bacterium]|nr:hypothetical protein [Mycobacteriales bacterium]